MLDHENVARVYFCGEDQGLHFIAFEFVEGDNLRQLIDRRGAIPAAECVRYMIQVAAGLSHAAERGVVHRDIKPSNIIITPDGRAKIVDMGLARHLDAINGGVTHSGVTLGTFDYISPEQALDPRRADVRSDIYSLGCALTMRLPVVRPCQRGLRPRNYRPINTSIHSTRAIEPDIPDDVAVILSRMMAKNPDQRYQTPADLIGHLKGVAERLRLSLDMVANDSTVRAVPASRALVAESSRLRLGWMAAVAAVIIAVVASATLPGSNGRSTQPAWAQNLPDTIAEPPIGPASAGTQNLGQPATGVVVVSTAKRLAQALADPRTKQVHLSAGTYDLREHSGGIVYTGTERNELKLIGSPTGDTRIILNASHLAAIAGSPSAGSLTIKTERLTISDVRFEIHATFAIGELFGVEGAATQAVGVFIQSATANPPQVHLMDCAFLWKDAPEEEAVSVAVAHPNSKSVQVDIERCVFDHGRDLVSGSIGLQVPPRAHVRIVDSGFGAHTAAIQVAAAKEDDTEPPPAQAIVKLIQSSFILESQGVVVSAVSPAAVMAGYCVFAQAGPEQTPIPAVLQSDKLDGMKFSGIAGQKNAYFQVNPLATGTGEAARTYSFDECTTNRWPITDVGAVVLAQRPWSRPNPVEALATADPWVAFRLKIETEPALFLPKGSDPRVVGAQFRDQLRNVRRAYPEIPWPPPEPARSTSEPRLLVWYPALKLKDGEPLPRDTFSDLDALLRAARGGDTILIRHSGLLHLKKTIELEKPRGSATGTKLTFRPSDGSTPVLTPDPEWGKLDQSLFRLIGGEVEFNGVQFLLQPSKPRSPQAVSAVTVAGGKGCAFTRCVFTLLEEDDAKAAAVLITDPATFMVMDGATRQTPEVKFDRCVLRGRGRGVWAPASRTVKVDMNQSLTALDGPLFLAQSAGTPGMNAARSSIKLMLTHVTALLGGPLIELKGAGKVGEMGTSGLVQMNAEANACLFAGVPGAGQPLVELDGIDAAESMRILGWQVQKGNRYANFDATAMVMIVRPGGEGNMPKELNWNQWIGEFAREPPLAGKPLGTVTFEKAPTGLRDLAAIRPADVAIKESDFPELNEPKLGDTGADAKMLPTPWVSE